jgi:hypothetical protein
MTTMHAPPSRFRLTAATLALFTYSTLAVAQAQAPAATTPLPWATAQGQQPGAQGGQAPAQPASPSAKTFSQEELDQLVAPIALYPDSLFAHVLMASTYPIEVVQAERWVKANSKLKDKALEDALQKQTWDESVKSLCVFPQVLTMMSEKLDWTQKLGDAFLAQKEDVMATAQSLRSKAVAQGALKDSDQQKVVTEKVEQTTIIKIEPSNPEVVYVPTYNPTVVYGAWPYPAYPPYYYYPPGYVAGGALLGFTAGVIVGGALWGNVGWGNNDINIDIDRQNNFNRNTSVNRSNVSNTKWQHNSEHRGAVPYKDRQTAQKYDRGGSQGSQARDAYRGRSDAGAATRGGDSAARASAAGTARSGGAAERTGGGQSFNRDYSGTRGGSAFDSGSRAQTRDYSSRGNSSMASSRSSAGASRGSMGGGGGRGGGGGGRGGGRR